MNVFTVIGVLGLVGIVALVFVGFQVRDRLDQIAELLSKK